MENNNHSIPHFEVLPKHIGIIMDGNGRWAKNQGLSRSEGHKQGAKTFRKICEYANDLGIGCLTFYAFSVENWKRPEDEISSIMNLLREYLYEAQERESENAERGFCYRFIGSQDELPEDIVELIQASQDQDIATAKTVVNIAVNYGGRQEILRAVQQIANKVAEGELEPKNISLEDISSSLYTAGLPDPDLIIRTSGEFRISNFLIWQSAYAEYSFTDVLWPDFSLNDFDNALQQYANRNRRFGGI